MNRQVYSMTYEASDSDKERLLKTAYFGLGRLYYNRNKKNWKCKCTKCGREYEANDTMMRQIKNAKKCFYCGNDIITVIGRKGAEISCKRDWIMINNEQGAINGYEVVWKTNEGKPSLISCTHVLHHANDKTFLYGVVKSMGYCLTMPWDHNRWKWRAERKSYNPYMCYFTQVEECEEDMNRTRKEMYLSISKLEEYKSNQITFIKQGIYNENQLKYIKVFDLNYAEDLLRFEKYISVHRCPSDLDDKYNVGILEYLNRTNQSIYSYKDYVTACRTLGIKPGKPKDLTDAEAKLLGQIKAIQDKERADQIIKRREELLQKEYSKGDYAVHVFIDIQEMVEVGSILHNCIGKMYVEPYASKRTDVYYGTKEGKITFAFEINRKRLAQLRTFNNGSVDAETAKFVKGWCKRYGYAC